MQNTVIVADGKNTTLRNIFCVTQETETKQNKYEGWDFNSGNYLFTTDTK